MDEEPGYTSLDICINNLSMMQEGVLLVEGRAIKTDRSICLYQATATDENGQLIAHATSKLMVLQGKQSINHATLAMGASPLPPKFLD